MNELKKENNIGTIKLVNALALFQFYEFNDQR